MNEEDIKSYQELRASQGLPEISDKDALVEAAALISLISIVVDKNEGK